MPFSLALSNWKVPKATENNRAYPRVSFSGLNGDAELAGLTYGEIVSKGFLYSLDLFKGAGIVYAS